MKLELQYTFGIIQWTPLTEPSMSRLKHTLTTLQAFLTLNQVIRDENQSMEGRLPKRAGTIRGIRKTQRKARETVQPIEGLSLPNGL